MRVGAQSGTPREDLGVLPTVRHRMTRNDLLAGNKDLLDRAGALLADIPVRRLDMVAVLDDGALRVDLTVANAGRADVYVDGRPRASVDTPTNEVSITVPGVDQAAVVRARASPTGSWSSLAPPSSRPGERAARHAGRPPPPRGRPAA